MKISISQSFQRILISDLPQFLFPNRQGQSGCSLLNKRQLTEQEYQQVTYWERWRATYLQGIWRVFLTSVGPF